MTEEQVRKILQIEGMTCTSCEMRIENKLKNLDGMFEAKAVYSSSNVYVTYDINKLGLDIIIETIEKLDYKVQNVNSETDPQHDSNRDETLTKGNKANKTQVVGIGLIILAIYMIINHTIGFNFIPQVDQSMGYGILFVVGVLTSLHCIAMCGGINLSVCVQYKAEDDDSRFSRLKPSALYNMGRVISYTIIGGIVGALGSVVSFSGTFKGIIAIISGVFMVIMGLNMLNIFPWLRKLNPRMPKIFGSKIHNNAGNKGPLMVGILNGLMPCGPLQAMQLYALGTGSFTAGAISMFLFSVGTVPLMFSFGALSSFLSGKFTHKMLKVSAVLVMILGIIMFNRGLNLSGYDVALAFGSAGTNGSIAKIENGIQVVTTKLESGSYAPIIVQNNIPVKWVIQVDKENLNGCNNAITSREFGIENKRLTVGDNIVEFTPQREGNFVYTCWMGMISSSIKVVSDINNISEDEIQAPGTNEVSNGQGSIPTDEVAVAEIKDGIQYVSIDVNDNRFSPAVVIMQKGIETKWVINGKELNEHNSRLIFPEYNAGTQLEDGDNELKLIPEADFTFMCEQGILNGYVKVVDDLKSIDINSIKDEVSSYTPSYGGFGQGSGGGASCH